MKNEQNGPCTHNSQALLNDLYFESDEPCLENAMYVMQMNWKWIDKFGGTKLRYDKTIMTKLKMCPTMNILLSLPYGYLILFFVLVLFK